MDNPTSSVKREAAEHRLLTVSLKDRLQDRKTLAGFSIGAAILVFFVLRVEIDSGVMVAYIRAANLWLLLLAFAVHYAGFLVRGLRWRMLLRHAGFELEPGVTLPSLAGLVEIIYLSWFVNCIVPAKLGDVYRGYLLKKNGNASFSRTLGTIFGERIVDVLVLFALLCLSGVVIFRNLQSALRAITLVFVLGLVLVVAMIIVLMVLRFEAQHLARLVPARFRVIFDRFQQGTVRTFDRSLQLKLYALTAIVWGCEVARFYLVVRSVHVTILALPVVTFAALASSLLTTIPFTPAGLGAVEGAGVAILALFGAGKNLAGSVVVLDRAISYWSNIVIGALVYVLSRKK